MTEYKRPLAVDTTRYEQSEQVLKAMSVTDEYFADEKPVDPLVLIIESLLATLPEDEREVVEMCLFSRISQHEAARMLGYINANGKEDHKMVARRLKWALRKLNDTLNSPSFALAIAGHKLPVDMPKSQITEKLSTVINNMFVTVKDEDDSE
jgi:DNA-directed RNA polymerase specialized sigma subunit